ncbi:uncharacterized protein LOC141691705 [Apium graveolens]|uniref:uncharacterized protein LOC141691705 n=1 Tax=Apium graveolens TaxID=4045 RepID=UPI003D7A9E5A
MVCISSVTYTFTNNGKVFGEVQPYRDDCYIFFRANGVEARTMKSILDRYERLSEQAVNFNKSSIYFNPNTLSADREEICQSLQVQEVNEPGKYLGLSMKISRKKISVFQFLIDKVKQKLQGWGTKSVSRAGKATLIQTVAQTIPNFLDESVSNSK